MKLRISLLVLATLVFTVGAFAQIIVPQNVGAVGSPFQARYFSNLTAGDSYINITNDGSVGGSQGLGGIYASENICVNVYTFDPAEELISCCACLVTPNGLNSLSAQTDLISNTLTPATPSSIVVKLLASKPASGTCNAAAVDPTKLVSAMHAWATTLHANTSTTPTSYGLTETEFSTAQLSAAEFGRLTQLCAFIQGNGSGWGICKSCRAGGLGAARQ